MTKHIDILVSEFYRKCPVCSKVLWYKTKKTLARANKLNIECSSCSHIKFDISLSDKYSKNCPFCKIEIKYNLRASYIDSLKNNSACGACANKKYYPPFIRNCPECDKKLVYTYFKTFKRHKNKNSLCRSCSFFKSNSRRSSYNPNACKIFEEINQELKWNGQHAERGGEFLVLSYKVDYYEPNLNIVIEYDEKYHKYRKIEDAERQRRIEKHLKCKFYRIDEGQDWRSVIA